MLSALWLPLAEGCQAGTVLRALDTLPRDPAMSWIDWLEGFLVLYAYTNGTWLSGVILLTAIFSSKRVWQVGLAVQFSLTLALVTLLILNEVCGVNDLKSGLELFLGIFPIVTIPTIWIGCSIRRRQWIEAWAKLQHSWTLAALTFLQLQVLFARRLFVGYFIFITGLVGMFITVELVRNRMVYDLWDRTVPPAKFRFSVRTLLGWMTAVALIIGYYQSVAGILEWLFGHEE